MKYVLAQMIILALLTAFHKMSLPGSSAYKICSANC